MIELTLILLTLSAFAQGIFNGSMDRIKEMQLDKNIWTNKWECNSLGVPLPPVNEWWYFGLWHVKHKERFIFSSTILVFTTDAWHLFKFLMFSTSELVASVIVVRFLQLPLPLVFNIFFGLKIIRGLGFVITHKK
jgi:hypothetical protein